MKKIDNKTKKLPYLQENLMLTDKGYKDLKKAIAACTLTNFSMIIPVWISLYMIVEVIKPFLGQEISWTKMWFSFIIAIIGVVLIFLCKKYEYRKTYGVSYMESENSRIALAEHIRKMPMSVFNSKDLSELTTNLMGDVAIMERVLNHMFPQLISNGISVTIMFIMFLIWDWRMALAIFISVPFAFLIILLSRKLQVRMGRKHSAAKLKASEQVQEYIEGIKVIKACNLDGQQFDALENALRTMMNLAIKFEVGSGVFVAGAQVVLQSGVGITVFVGINLMTEGQIELAPLILCLLIVTRIYGPFLTELTLLPELFYNQIAINRMRAIMDIELMDGDDKIEIDDYDIKFKNVDFKYNKDGKETIKNMSFIIPAKSITALVGPSGSGKSTVARLIARFWDVDKGSISVGGIDVSTMDPEHLMEYMSFVFQDVVLFNDTVYNNIKIGNMNASDEDIYAAAKAARCDEFVKKMPNGYDTLLGENGSTISGGERQRLSIARALLKDAPIVLLDEATASLDPESESSIQEAINILIAGKTVVVIAHRLRSIANVDKIIVLDDGRVTEEGTHDELMARGGLYHKLFSIQKESLGWNVKAG